MGLTIVILNNEEEFLQFLDPELCTLTETHEKKGIRTLEFEYKFQDLHKDKQLFRTGNKIWVSGDTNLTDCLYVINTPVETDVYKSNSFQCAIEEVLVELNYAPLFNQLELTSANGFTLTTINGQQNVTINWNFLNYWFGEYFNIGVVQKCLNESHNKVVLSGTMTLMGLIRYIEEETGNVFVTRYKKDILSNTIHRYLDFLNPLNVSKDWVLNVEYDFVEDEDNTGVFDQYGNPSADEDEFAETEELDDLVDFSTDYTPLINVDPTICEFRITDKNLNLLNSDGLIYTGSDEETPLRWDNSDIGFNGDEKHVVFNLSMVKNVIGLICNNKSFAVNSTEIIGTSYGRGFVTIADENTPSTKTNTSIPDDSYFTIYNTETQKTIYSICINREIGHVHEEILDFGFNIENVKFETDESDTFTAISPILSFDNDSGTNKLSRSDMGKIITAWKSLSITKGEIVPMIVQKVNVQASTLNAARNSLGPFNRSHNYYSRPYKPNDSIDTSTPSNSTWEFWRATAYWKAPFDKHAGELHVHADSLGRTEYTEIHGRQDTRETRDLIRPKIGPVETSEEDVYAIYNNVAMKLKDKMYPKFSISVDVANLKKGQFNPYQLHDKVYVKLPDYNELITARVVKTSKEAHDVAKNSIELDNYSEINIKNVQNSTYIEANNVSFKYPSSKNLTVRLINEDYNEEDEYSVQYLANELITFVLYKVENNSSTLTKTTYTKVTNANGYATITMKYDPGDYELDIKFGGNEEYEESSITVQVNVSGTKEVTNAVDTKKYLPKELRKTKTTKKPAKAGSTKARYYSKYGVSPDNKYIMAIGRPSAGGELGKYGYKFYKTILHRKCPMCGSKELYWSIFWTGNEKGNWGVFPATGRKEAGSAEGHIFCKKCDADFSIFGNNHNTNHKDLKVYKKSVVSKKADAYTLKKGKMYYDTVKITNKAKSVVSKKDRKTGQYIITKKLKEQSLKIVGNSMGLDAAKKIARWCSNKKNLKYLLYGNFKRKPVTVFNKKSGNCCDSTRLMLTMMYAVGCHDKLKLEYVHCHNSSKNIGHVFAKITTKSSGKSRYVDPCLKIQNGKNPWGHHLKGYGPVVGTHEYNGPSSSPF